jgi:hypothetical protein
MNTIQVIENYIGDVLTPKSVRRITEAPLEQIIPLIEKLDRYYEAWFEQEQADRTSSDETSTTEYFYALELSEPRGRGQAWTSHYKKFLLYFPTLAAPDPLAGVIYTPLVMALALQQPGAPTSVQWTAQNQNDFNDAVRTLAEIAPAVRGQDLRLVPDWYLFFRESVQAAARREIEALNQSAAGDTYLCAIEKAARQVISGSQPEVPDFRGIARKVADFVKVRGQFCSLFAYTPVAGDPMTYAALQQEYSSLAYATTRSNEVSQVLARFEIPGVDKMDVKTVLRVRRDDSTFAAFRRDFSQLIEKVYHQTPRDQATFNIEFKEAADDLLTRRIEEIKKACSASPFEKILVPGAASIGAGAVAVASMHAAFPPTAIAAAALAPFGWLAT